MDENIPQTFHNHTRFLPAYHFVAFPLFGVYFFWTLYHAVVHYSPVNVVNLLLSIGLMLLFFLSRIMVITVQDRVIRLEMRLRMREVLPADLYARFAEFGVKQLVALRFAGDNELPTLARKVLDEKIQDQKVIKHMISNWQADNLRA